MKTVFSNSGTAHAFASRSQSEGRSANHNLYFNGDTLFSYGYHFPIAHFYGDKVLMNSDHYSPSTSRHQSLAAQALSHFDQVYIIHFKSFYDVLTYSSKGAYKNKMATQLIARYASDIESLKDKFSRMRSEWRKDNCLSEIARLEKTAAFLWHDVMGRKSDPFTGAKKLTRADELKEMRDRCSQVMAHFDKYLRPEAQEEVKDRIDDSLDLYPKMRSVEANKNTVWRHDLSPLEYKESVRAMGKAWRAEYDTKRLEMVAAWQWLFDKWQGTMRDIEARQEAEQLERANEWLDGNGYAPRMNKVILRVKDDELQTSHGASVPIDEARKLTRAAILCRKAGKAWNRNGETKPVGMFQTDRITENGDLIVGCHTIKWDEIAKCVVRFVPDMVDDIKSAN